MDAVETMMSVRETPWHKKGVVLSDAPRTWREAARAAGADWTVHAMPVGLLGDAQGIDGYRAIVRETDMRVLSIVSESYTPIQNAQVFSFFDEVVAEGLASWETAGVLHDGRVVWAQVRMGQSFDVVPGDEVRSYGLLSNAHDTSRKARYLSTPQRVVCANTLAAAESGGEFTFGVRHTGNAPLRLEDAKRALGFAAKQFADTADAYRRIAKVQLTGEKLASYLEASIDATRDEKGNLSSRTRNVLGTIQELFEGKGRGSALPGVRGTAWGAYNAVTEWVDYVRDDGKDAGARLDSIAFGTGADIKKRALRAALAMV
jgi:phage/plasmid-like protein (TIGR03299 family)